MAVGRGACPISCLRYQELSKSETQSDRGIDVAVLEEAEAQPAMHLVEHHAKIEIPVCTENLIRDLVWINVTANPTAGWVARQITGAFPWDEAPRHLIRDRDRIYGSVVTRRLRAMGIRDKPTAPASPLCRTADRIDPPEAGGPHDSLGRGARCS